MGYHQDEKGLLALSVSTGFFDLSIDCDHSRDGFRVVGQVALSFILLQNYVSSHFRHIIRRIQREKAVHKTIKDYILDVAAELAINNEELQNLVRPTPGRCYLYATGKKIISAGRLVVIVIILHALSIFQSKQSICIKCQDKSNNAN